MTKKEAREWLDGKSTKTCTFRQISEVRSFAKQLGFKVSEYKQRAVMRVRFCTLSMELKEMYWATPHKYSPGYIELSDLLAIEIVEEPYKQTSASIRAFVKTVKDEFYDMNLGYLDFVADRFIMDNADKIEPDHRALLEEAVKLLEKMLKIRDLWAAPEEMPKENQIEWLALCGMEAEIKAFLEANKTIPKSK